MATPSMGLPRTPLAGLRTVQAPNGLRRLLVLLVLVSLGFARTLSAEPLQQVLLPPADEAAESGWAVVALSGPVVYRTGVRQDWRTLSRSQILRPAFEVITGAGGFAKLVKAHDQVTIEENTHLVFPASDPLDTKTSIFQLLGSAYFEVIKRQRWNFEVKTPFLAAVVKGTSFRVSVARSGADVEVESGTVGVSAEGGGSVDVTPGRTASVAAGLKDLAVAPTSSPTPVSRAAAAAAAAARAAVGEGMTDRVSLSGGDSGGDDVDRSDRGSNGAMSRNRASRKSRKSKAGARAGKGDGGVGGDAKDDGDDSDDDD